MDLFGVPIQWKDTELNNDAIADYCFSMMNKSEGRKLSNLGGWQSNDLESMDAPLDKLAKTIEDSVNDFASELGLPEQKTVSAWVNINGYKDFNIEHIHPSFHLAGVYYVQTHENCGDIAFSHPNKDILSAYWWPHIANTTDSRLAMSWKVPAKEGRLYIFPSWLYHRVEPNLDESKKRISIAWNSVAK